MMTRSKKAWGEILCEGRGCLMLSKEGACENPEGVCRWIGNGMVEMEWE